MIKRAMKLFLITTMIFALTQAFGGTIYPFFLERPDGSSLEGYITLPSEIDSPIVFAIQGSTCQSVLQWHQSLSHHADRFGLGVISLEKRGISQSNIDLPTYQQTNSLQNREEDYLFCVEHMNLILPDWEGKMVFWGESEGGMIAAHLADQLPNDTGAILLFGAGGGMKPREEVKWAVQNRLQQQGAEQEEMDNYIHFLEEQMQAMMVDPTADKEFWGNTYKWWASFLGLEEAVMPLKSTSIPICLIHGVEDSQVPVESADRAAIMLESAKRLTYLRLDGYGHDLDNAAITEAACRWLTAVLLGEEMVTDVVVTPENSLASSSENTSVDTYSRGKKDKDKDKKGETKTQSSIYADGGSDGELNMGGEVDVYHKFDDRYGLGVNAAGGIGRSPNGNIGMGGSLEFRVGADY